jgi:hypothetical protein
VGKVITGCWALVAGRFDSLAMYSYRVVVPLGRSLVDQLNCILMTEHNSHEHGQVRMKGMISVVLQVRHWTLFPLTPSPPFSEVFL